MQLQWRWILADVFETCPWELCSSLPWLACAATLSVHTAPPLTTGQTIGLSLQQASCSKPPAALPSPRLTPHPPLPTPTYHFSPPDCPSHPLSLYHPCLTFHPPAYPCLFKPAPAQRKTCIGHSSSWRPAFQSPCLFGTVAACERLFHIATDGQMPVLALHLLGLNNSFSSCIVTIVKSFLHHNRWPHVCTCLKSAYDSQYFFLDWFIIECYQLSNTLASGDQGLARCRCCGV